jgi:hypothetical protein
MSRFHYVAIPSHLGIRRSRCFHVNLIKQDFYTMDGRIWYTVPPFYDNASEIGKFVSCLQTNARLQKRMSLEFRSVGAGRSGGSMDPQCILRPCYAS